MVCLQKQGEKGKVYLPKFILIIGCIGTAFFLALSILMFFTDEPWWMALGFLPFSFLGATLIIAFYNCRISYDENEFTVKNFWGAKKTYTYEQVTGIREGMNDTYLYIGKRRVLVELLSVGGMQFIMFVGKKYRLLHGGRNIPEVKKDKHDIFKGNVKDASGVIVAYSLVGVFLVGCAIFILVDFLTPETPENTIEKQVIFQEAVVGDRKTILLTEDNQTYQIRRLEEEKMDVLRTLCDEGAVVTVYVKEVTPKDGENYYSVKALLYEGEFLLSFDETNRAQRRDDGLFLCMLLVFVLIWAGYIVASIIVGRNPNKYGKKVVRFFFKDGYVKF